MDKRLRVLFVIPNLRAGGAERVFSTIIRHLDRRRFCVELGVLDDRDMAFPVPDDVNLVTFGRQRASHGIAAILAHVRRTGPDVVLSTLDHLNVLICASRLAWPRRVALAVRLAHQPDAYPAWQQALMSIFLRRADVIVAQSPEMAQRYTAGLRFPSAKLRVLRNPVEIPPGEAARPSRPDGPLRLVSVGRMVPIKGFDLLIDALASAQIGDARLTVVGDGPDRPALEAQAARNGLRDRIAFVGYQPDPGRYLQEADAYVLPSRNEGFPNVVLEAIASGLPVISTPVPGVRSVLEPIAGCIVTEACSASALAAGLQTFAAKAPLRVDPAHIHPYRADVAVKAYEALLEELADGRRPAGRDRRP